MLDVSIIDICIIPLYEKDVFKMIVENKGVFVNQNLKEFWGSLKNKGPLKSKNAFLSIQKVKNNSMSEEGSTILKRYITIRRNLRELYLSRIFI